MTTVAKPVVKNTRAASLFFERMRMICRRCGQCCQDCGTSFWIHGNLKGDGEPFGDHVLLNKLGSNVHYKDDGLPCKMLQVIGGIPFCAIERYAGLEYKPVVCRKFPEIGEDCFFGKQETVQP